MKPHILSEKEERLLALGSAALDGYDDAFSQLTDVDMKFGVLRRREGRGATAHAKLFQLVSGQARSRAAEARVPSVLRRVPGSPIHARGRALLLGEGGCLSRAGAQLSVRARGLAFQGRRAGRGLRRLDCIGSAKSCAALPLLRICAGACSGSRSSITTTLMSRWCRKLRRTSPFDEAIEKVLASLAPLGAEYVESLGAGLRGRWCDRYETKASAAAPFPSGSYGAPPYILMNYKGDVFCRRLHARARGRAFHAHLVRATDPALSGLPTIRFSSRRWPRPSTRSCSRIISSSRRPIRKMRAYIINRQIDDIRGTLFRQTMFAEFEKVIHAIEESGDGADARCFQKRISQAARGLLSARISCSIPNSSWNACASRISTARFTFTNMPRAFRRRSRSRNKFCRERPAAVEALLGFLKSGGSKFPLETLQAAGVDMRTPAPVESTLRLFERRLDELEALL